MSWTERYYWAGMVCTRLRGSHRATGKWAGFPRALVAVTLIVSQQMAGAFAQDADHPYFPDEFEVTEGRGPAVISVVRDSTAAPVTVTYTTRPSGAKEGRDFLPVRGSLHFPAANASRTFEVPIVDDAEPEEEESVLLILYDSAGKAIDFSELVIHSDERLPPDPDEGPGAGPGANTSGPRSGLAAGAAAGKSAATPPSSSAPAGEPAPEEIPTILLQPVESESTGVRRNADPSATGDGQSPLASRPSELDRPVRLLLGLSALGVLAGGAALFWLRSREKELTRP